MEQQADRREAAQAAPGGGADGGTADHTARTVTVT